MTNNSDVLHEMNGYIYIVYSHMEYYTGGKVGAPATYSIINISQ